LSRNGNGCIFLEALWTLTSNGKIVWFIVRRLWCYMRSRLPFYSRQVEPDH
jgi:hypothetical protein